MLKLAKELCSGCTACFNICPKKCIEMKADADGFLVPVVADKSLCIDCGLCDKVCPVLNPVKEQKISQNGYIVQHKDSDILMESTSGGAFTAIADYVIDQGGIVYGAAYNKELKVTHQSASTVEELSKFRNSKYVQSDLGSTFSEISEILNSGKKVCFSGTPCQIEGLRVFLGKDYDNLILVDVVCHGISSPLIWDKYLEMQKDKKADHIYFRWKHYGYKYSTMSFFKDGKEIYFGGVESDSMLRSYFTNNCDRNICYDCPFKKRYRVSDITIWDCFQPGFFDKSFNDDRGTTSVLIHSQKGKKAFLDVLNKSSLKYCEIEPDELVFGNNEMIGSVKKGAQRDNLLKDAAEMSGKELFEKYFPSTVKIKIKKSIRIILLKLGIYNRIKYILFKRRRKSFKA